MYKRQVIEFGKYQLKYENKTQEKMPKHNGFENTVVMRPARLVVPASGVEAEAEKIPNELVSHEQTAEDKIAVPVTSTPPQQTSAEAAAHMQRTGHLQVLSGSDSGRDLSLNKALTTLGKPGVQVAVITKRPHGYFIAHVEGEKRPIVNGQNIGMQAFALNDHDVIDLAGVKMEFYLA